MKARIATALSLVGVLSAGSAAALVNSQILGGDSGGDATSTLLPPLAAADVTSTTSTTSTVVSTVDLEAIPLEVPSTSSSTTVDAGASLVAYEVGDAGVVTLDSAGGRLVLVAAVPNAGWTVTRAEDDQDDDSQGDDEVQVEFSSATVRVEFEASLVDGRIVPRVESRSITPSAATPPAAPSPTTATTLDDHGDDGPDHDVDDDHDDHVDDDDHSGSNSGSGSTNSGSGSGHDDDREDD